VLSCTAEDREALLNQQTVFLTHAGKTIAKMTNISIFPHRKEERCARQFGLNNKEHPYQKYIHEECGDWLIGGELHVFERIVWNDGLDRYRFTPFELRKKFMEINVIIFF